MLNIHIVLAIIIKNKPTATGIRLKISRELPEKFKTFTEDIAVPISTLPTIIKMKQKAINPIFRIVKFIDYPQQ